MFSVTSSAFKHLDNIPEKYCSASRTTPPPLVVHDIPTDAVDLALICWDPDAPLPLGFTHWTAFHIPVDRSDADLSMCRFDEGPNGLGRLGWTGPEPPRGHGLHHYYFWAYALRERVPEPLSREVFLTEFEHAIFAQARLVVTFERR